MSSPPSVLRRCIIPFVESMAMQEYDFIYARTLLVESYRVASWKTSRRIKICISIFDKMDPLLFVIGFLPLLLL
jgi:hypothetical protein